MIFHRIMNHTEKLKILVEWISTHEHDLASAGHGGRILFIPGIVKLFESPGIAGRGFTGYY